MTIYKSKKTQNRLTPKDVMMIIGVSLLLFGGMHGFFCYVRFNSGMPGRISNSQLGTRYIPEQKAGNPADKSSAVFSFYIAGIGLVFTLISVATNLLGKYFRRKC